jgi:uncharacterized membrane protein YtjA (UPF0391 family)
VTVFDQEATALNDFCCDAHEPIGRTHGTIQSASCCLKEQRKETHMLQWILILLLIAAVASLLGFRGVAGASAGIAKILIFIVLIVMIIALFTGVIIVA